MEFVVSDADSALKQALNSVGRSNRIVICGAAKEKQMLLEQIKYSEQSISQIIETSAGIDPVSWFEERKAELAQDDIDLNEYEGSWPGNLNSQSITAHLDLLSGKPLKTVLLAKLAVEAPWQIPAHFKFGGWNECPDPETQCAVWRRWFNHFGAEIVSVSHDVIEAWVPNPPNNEKDAMSLAWEQFLYCADIVDQGVETISNLGGSLINSNTWYFWWD